jgi:glycosyltransferase involved in cell wall biosynthesis
MDAVLVLKNELWSEIRKALPEAELHIYGAYSNEASSKLNSTKDGFIIKGRAEDVNETLRQYRVLLAPLRFGAGLKGKLLDSMTAGTPSITTASGAEGIAEITDWPGAVAQSNADFISAAIHLYQSENEWQLAVDKGDKIVSNSFHPILFTGALLEKIGYIKKNREALRQSNFIGAMLQQQAFSATKFMSKWIEEKNRKLT